MHKFLKFGPIFINVISILYFQSLSFSENDFTFNASRLALNGHIQITMHECYTIAYTALPISIA